VRSRLLVLVLAAATACSSAGAQRANRPSATASASASVTRTPPATARAVAHPTVWLCAPGLPHNPCEGGLGATAVTADGTTTVERPGAGATPVDCFYVYPTVSEAKAVNAPLRATAAEVRTVRAQAARFSTVCRVFAPVYRQLTVQALVTGQFGNAAGRALAHADVVAAWHDYLNHNPARRFVLIGHSQGSFELLRLLQEEIDGNDALRSRLVSALLLGGNVKVPHGKDVGGDLQHIPLCRSARQRSCVVTYNSYDTTPPADALFGQPDLGRHLDAACTNPAALGGGSGPLLPYLPTSRLAAGSLAVPGTYRTGFVSYPGYLTAACHEENGRGWLEVTVHRRPGDVRPLLPKMLGPVWGLHLVDVNLALGNLVGLVHSES
jgi:hypothetical protein